MTAPRHKYLNRFYVRRQRHAVAMEELGLYTTAQANNPAQVASIVRSVLGADEWREHFVVLFMDVGLRVVGFEVAAIGLETTVDVDPRVVFRGAILAGAHAIVVAHNHPTDRAQPSANDDALTQKLAASGRILGIEVLDHVVVTDSAFYSYAAHDRMPKG